MDTVKAYDAWLDRGNFGTIDDFLDSMANQAKGEKGDDGQDGFLGKATGVETEIGQIMGHAIGGAVKAEVDRVVESGVLNGKNGEDGNDGLDGLSAYEIAVDGGFAGSERDWLETLKGDKGETGPTGLPGLNGKDGLDGLDGAQGPKGEAGAKGDKGDNGLSAFDLWKAQNKKRANKTLNDFLDYLMRDGFTKYGGLFLTDRTSGGGGSTDTFKNLTTNYAATTAEKGYNYTNTGATSMVSVGFNTVTGQGKYKLYVTDADGFKIINPGTIYISSQPLLTDISSTAIGATATVTVISPTMLILDITGNWDF